MTQEIGAQEAAELVGVSHETIRNWCREGLLKHRRVGRQQIYHVDREDLIRLATEFGYLLADDSQE